MLKESNKAPTIGVLIGNVHSPYTVQLLQGMAEAAKAEDVNILYFLGAHSGYLLESMLGQSQSVNYDYQFNTIYDYALLAEADALIISYGTLCIFLEDINRKRFLQRFQGIPCLLVEEEGEDDAHPNHMIADNYGGMFQLAEHLLRDHGYRRFVYVSGPSGNTDAKERMAAFLDACTQYGVTIPEDAIEYGDYSEYADKQIRDLLRRYPNTQAIVCANDEMAWAAYRLCRKAGMRIGKDIAITGFDNNTTAELIDPPLTTVKMSGFNIGYRAIFSALCICKGKNVGGLRIPTRFRKGESCGCGSETHDFPPLWYKDEDFIASLASRMTDEFMKTKANPTVYNKCLSHIKTLIGETVELFADNNGPVEEIMGIIGQITGDEIGHYISYMSFSKEVEALFSAVVQSMESLDGQGRAADAMITIQRKMHTMFIFSRGKEIDAFQRKAWLVQMIAGELTETLDSEEEFFANAIGKLRLLGVKSSYIYLLEDVKIHYAGERWVCPERLRLAAYHSGDKTVSYPKQLRPTVSRQRGFPRDMTDFNGRQLTAFILFSDERQYGLLLCEIDPAALPVLYFTSLQIGTALRFLELRNAEADMRRQLERSIQTIEAKNEVLNFISEYDDLTKLLNRRGFMERIVTMNQTECYIGRKALFVFGDLDHLKEINDHFGHGAGDFAIRKAGELLRDGLCANPIIGRIGGDEFVAMVMMDLYASVEQLKREIKQAFTAFNEQSKKPYYIEMSVGITDFVCGSGLDLTSIISKADEYLYMDKKNRRQTAVKPF